MSSNGGGKASSPYPAFATTHETADRLQLHLHPFLVVCLGRMAVGALPAVWVEALARTSLPFVTVSRQHRRLLRLMSSRR